MALTGGVDSGLNEVDVLKAWSSEAGLLGHRIEAWAPLAVRHTQTLRQAIAFYGLAYLGVLMPAPAQAQFEASMPWDLTGTPDDYQIQGGHAVPAVGYYHPYLYVVTWGALQPVTWRWWHAYGEEAYAIVPDYFEARGGDARGIDLASLKADLAKL